MPYVNTRDRFGYWLVHCPLPNPPVFRGRVLPEEMVLIGTASSNMRIAVGSDHRGSALRHKVIVFLEGLGVHVVDVGVDSAHAVDYPEIAANVARQVSEKLVDRGILICGSGLGMAIVANKFPGVRAAPCHDEITAEVSRRHNDLNVLCLAADILGPKLADRLVDVWLRTEFEGDRHLRRIRKIAELECRNGRHEASFPHPKRA